MSTIDPNIPPAGYIEVLRRAKIYESLRDKGVFTDLSDKITNTLLIHDSGDLHFPRLTHEEAKYLVHELESSGYKANFSNNYLKNTTIITISL